MTALEKFQQSNAWSKEYDLPLVPMHNNHHLYMAYAAKIMFLADGSKLSDDKVYAHIEACRKAPGLFNRSPDGSGGVTSHDELMGIAYNSPIHALEILNYLTMTDGEYINVDDEPHYPLKYNVYRFLWFMPFLKSCTTLIKINPITQLTWSLHLLLDAMLYKTYKVIDQGGRLRIWIMLDKMEQWVICKPAIWIWRWRMKKLGLSPKKMYESYLVECPVYNEIAPDSF